jgi:hypothetical protein
MSDHSYAQANAVINALRASSLEVALYTTMPNKGDAGGVEVSAGEYMRQSVTLIEPTDGETSNSAAIQFPEALGSWGTVAGVGLRVVGGTLRYLKALDAPVSVGAGQIFKVDVGDLTLSEVLP